MFLVNSQRGHFTATTLGSRREVLHLLVALLIPKLRGHFAEFLNKGYLAHLRIFSSPTCGGLRYGRQSNYHRDFSWQYAYGQFTGRSPPHNLSVLEAWIYLRFPPTGLDLVNQHETDLHFCVTP